MSEKKKIAGVIGAGSFGTAIANLVAENQQVLVYARKNEVVQNINEHHLNKGQEMHKNVYATNSIEEVVEQCDLIFPVVPSSDFKNMLQSIAPLLKPSHILIHGTKGLHIDKEMTPDTDLYKEDVLTMSELILKETGVVRVGCLAGPNLAVELAKKQPASAVIASKFDEVINEGREAIKSQRFQIYASNQLIGVELAGVLKNYVAIASGMSHGLGFGDNARAMLITRGMAEMIYIAKALGAQEKAFLGIAGIGDLIATCNSQLSRNFRVGYMLSQGKKLEDAVNEIGEVAEGVKTLKILKALHKYGFKAPLAKALYSIIFDNQDIQGTIDFLMRFPAPSDADYVR